MKKIFKKKKQKQQKTSLLDEFKKILQEPAKSLTEKAKKIMDFKEKNSPPLSVIELCKVLIKNRYHIPEVKSDEDMAILVSSLGCKEANSMFVDERLKKHKQERDTQEMLGLENKKK